MTAATSDPDERLAELVAAIPDMAPDEQVAALERVHADLTAALDDVDHTERPSAGR